MREHGRSSGITHFCCILGAVIHFPCFFSIPTVYGHNGELGWFVQFLIHSRARALFLASFGLGATINIFSVDLSYPLFLLDCCVVAGPIVSTNICFICVFVFFRFFLRASGESLVDLYCIYH
jgi:hypothetical protein